MHAYINTCSCTKTQLKHVWGKKKPSHHINPFFTLSPSHTHNTHAHAGADVTWLAWRTVDDRLDLAAPEMDRQSGYCSAGMIQRWDKPRTTESYTFCSKTSWLFRN